MPRAWRAGTDATLNGARQHTGPSRERQLERGSHAVQRLRVVGDRLDRVGLFGSLRRPRVEVHARDHRVVGLSLGALLAFFAVSGAGVVIDITGADPFVRILVLVAALLGLLLIGRFVWPWMGRVVRG